MQWDVESDEAANANYMAWVTLIALALMTLTLFV